jgi:hypothetical protein
MAEMEDPRGKYDGDPCPNCGGPRRVGKPCPRCTAGPFTAAVARSLRQQLADLDRPTSEMPVIPRFRLSGQHVCSIPQSGHGHCVHCDTGFVCQRCQHKGMRTTNCKPPHFILRCPVCDWEKWIHWIEYDLACPRCGNEHAFGTYTKSFERIIECPDCGVVPRGEAA